MQTLSDEGREIARRAAERHGVSEGAAAEMLRALAAGYGSQAQFNHPDLGGMGQWSRGGMLMIGDMFNNGLKARVDALANDLSAEMGQVNVLRRPEGDTFSSGTGWPAEFGSPSSSGSQNDMRYAFFPGSRRLAIVRGGVTEVYDSGDHMISGVGQQQGGDQSITFSTSHGPVGLSDLRRIDGPGQDRTQAEQPQAEQPDAAPRAPEAPAATTSPEPEATPTPPAAAPERDAPFVAPSAPPESPKPSAPASGSGHQEIFDALERLSDLKGRGILTEEEFAAKKKDLLARL
jgi:hypothetical protein